MEIYISTRTSIWSWWRVSELRKLFEKLYKKRKIYQDINLFLIYRRNFSSPHDYHHVEVANGIFVKNGFSLRKDYENVVKNIYKSEITPLEFARNPTFAKNYINDWVNRKTHGKIKTIISDEIAPETNVVIASALYFKALWEKSFLGSATQL